LWAEADDAAVFSRASKGFEIAKLPARRAKLRKIDMRGFVKIVDF